MNRDKDKKPVLTSPWKIGVFVALMLVVISFAVGYYMADIYGIDLKWLRVDQSGWQVDSFLFFKEMYPLVAGVVILSLICYFLITSSVRSYKYHLDSGQDYRKMISLAESIDDLTNPAQIAKLSDYPELQGVLRSYGDQIREISREIEETKNTADIEEFVSLVNALVNGDETVESDISGKWYWGLYERLKNAVKRDRDALEELREKTGLARAVSGKAALLMGRVREEVKMAEERISRMRDEVENLRSSPWGSEKGARNEIAPEGSGLVGALISDMEASVKKLKDIAKSFGEFSNENNNLALSLALMAAKGQISESELAQYAEKIRMSAEGFNRMSSIVGEISDTLFKGLNGFKERLPGDISSPGAAGSSEGISSGMQGLNDGKLLELMDGLSASVRALSDELREIEEILKEEAKDLSIEPRVEEDSAKRKNSSEGFVGEIGGLLKGEVNLENRAGEYPSDIGIDRGGKWQDEVERQDSEIMHDYSDSSPLESPAEDGGFDELGLFSGGGEFSGKDSVEADEAGASQRTETESDDKARGDELAREAEQEASSWMEMPGHRWVNVNVEQTGSQSNSQDVEVEVHKREEGEREEQRPGGSESARPSDEVFNAAEEKKRNEVKGYEEEEPIYDLFEIGAVELK